MPQHWGLVNPEPRRQSHPAARLRRGHIGRCRSFRAERAGPFVKGPPNQNPWAHAPPPSALTLAHPYDATTLPSDSVSQPRLANIKIRSAPEWPFPRGLASEHWGFATPEPLRQTHSTTTPPPGHIGAPPNIQGGRTGRALRAQSNIRKSHAINPLGPCSPSPEPSPQPAPPLAAQPLARACRPPGC